MNLSPTPSDSQEMESNQQALQTLDLWTGDAISSGQPPTSSEPEPSPVAKRTGLWAALIAIVAMLIGATASWVAIDNDLAPSLTGTFLSEGEHEAALATAQEAAYGDGYTKGHAVGTDAGELAGFADGQEAGQLAGYQAGRTDGYSDGYDVGYDAGGREAYDDGFYSGYDVGWSDGCLALFEALGTNRVGDWWDYYYSPSYASYFNTDACS